MLSIDGYIVDVELNCTPTFENEATSYPIESGAEFTDHIRALPTGLDCEGIISDTPINTYVQTTRELDGEIGEPGDETISRAAHTRLLEIHKRKEPITVVCALGTFDDMVMLTYSPKREGGSLRFTASFKHISIIENERTTVRVAVARAAGKGSIKRSGTFLESDRNNKNYIDVVKVPAGPNKGTSMYIYSQDNPDPSKRGKPVPDSVVDKATKDAGAVRIKYVNGNAVPYNDADYQPYVPKKERPYYPSNDHVKVPGPFNNNTGRLPGLGG